MVDLLATHMEMTGPPSSPPPRPNDDVAVGREWLAPDAYLELYRAIGEAVQWDARLRMPRDELEKILSNPATHLHILRLGSVPVGLCEFLNVGSPDVELAYFGLVPAMQGKRLGGYFLSHALADCWRNLPRRVWLRTDTCDHPAAIQTYERAGFRITHTVWETFPD